MIVLKSFATVVSEIVGTRLTDMDQGTLNVQCLHASEETFGR